MFLKFKGRSFLAAIGKGVLLSMALTGGVRIACFLLETPLSAGEAGKLFLLGSVVAGGASAFLYGRRLQVAPAPPPARLDQHFLV